MHPGGIRVRLWTEEDTLGHMSKFFGHERRRRRLALRIEDLLERFFSD